MNIVWRYITASRNTYAVLFAACEKYGFLLEPAETPEELAAADIVCYSLNSLNYADYVEEMQSLDAIVIAGGPHPSACPDEVLKVADYVVIGEGERSLPRLLSALTEGKNPSGIPGIASSTGYTPLDYSVRLDAFPCFTRMKGYIELTRGCPFNCGYCQTPRLHGRRMRHRSREDVVKAASRFRDARFVTPNAFAYGSADGRHPEVEKLERLLQSLPDNNIYLGTFPSEVRPEFVLPETAELVVQYCSNTNLHFGAQSGSDAVLKALHRGHGTAEVFSALDTCRDFHLKPVVDVIFGFPFETDEDEEKTLDLVKEVSRRGKIHVHYLTPLPGTDLAGVIPRPILPDIDKKLGQLALHGQVTGYWHDKVFG
ncbi:MAG TPA: TIGR04013 family B12-binding domain/radical SAM domain-containing protein [Methanocorpusculum sp.]|nr:TIGR04013 family B12-binding domain/radical SAM domain-containing protein [Methanocorpusculum sp.]